MLIKDGETCVFGYPRWYWTFGYFVSVPVALFICLIIYLYATRPLVTLAPSIFNLVLFSAVLYGVVWVSNKRRKLFADVIMTGEGIAATVVSERRGQLKQQLDTGVFTKWADVASREAFGPNDQDARQMGRMTEGCRLFVPNGRILIYGRLVRQQPGFDQVMAFIGAKLGQGSSSGCSDAG
jgi:hypothetical protein